MRFIIPVLLIAISVGLFAVYIDPTYSDIKSTQAEVASYDDALTKSKELQALRDRLSAERSAFSPEDLARLELMLPDTIDNIRLVIDIDSIASRYGLVIKDLKIAGGSGASAQGTRTASGTFDPTGDEVKSIDLSFKVSSDYETFLKLLRDLEDSLRVIDIQSIAFSADDGRGNASALTDYSITIRTYWLP